MLIISLLILVLQVNIHAYIGKKNNLNTYFVFDGNMQIYDTKRQSKIPFSFMKVFEDAQIGRVYELEKATILFTNKLDDMEKLKDIPYYSNCKWIYGLRSVNMFASKSILPLVLRYNYPKDHDKIIPKTWVIDHKNDLKDLYTAFNKNGTPKKDMILKQNIQRQHGLTFVKHIDDIHSSKQTNNVVCQLLLRKPYLINGRKINIRVYLLVICIQKNKQIRAYIYNDGFMYYTKDTYSSQIITSGTQITTGYIDRSIYDVNPLSIREFYNKTLSNKESGVLKGNINELFGKLMKSYESILKLNEFDDGPNHFIILGCDIAVDNQLNVNLLEINKGPDLNIKDERDGQIKHNMVKETINKILNDEEIYDDNYIKVAV
jgi:hypothetical protein